MICLLELCKQLCSGSKSVKGNPGKWNETLKYYAFFLHCFLQKGSTSEAKNLAVEKHNFFEEVYKKYSMLVISSFQGFFWWYKSTRSNFTAICGKMSEPSSNSSKLFFLSQDFHSISHSSFPHLVFDMWMHNTCPVRTHTCECVHLF